MTPANDNRHLLTSSAVRAYLGDVSDMTLWRWLADPAMHFPRPTIIRRRRYWDAAELEAWWQERAADKAA